MVRPGSAGTFQSLDLSPLSAQTTKCSGERPAADHGCTIDIRKTWRHATLVPYGVTCARRARIFPSDLEGHAPSWPSAQVLTDATAARPSNPIWLRLKAALGKTLYQAVTTFREDQ